MTFLQRGTLRFGGERVGSAERAEWERKGFVPLAFLLKGLVDEPRSVAVLYLDFDPSLGS
jgi:hypothetical protein